MIVLENRRGHSVPEHIPIKSISQKAFTQKNKKSFEKKSLCGILEAFGLVKDLFTSTKLSKDEEALYEKSTVYGNRFA